MPRGVRLNPQHDDRTRAKIQTSQIINRLQDFVFGKVQMTQVQANVALGLLRKTLPDLTTIEHQGEITKNYVMRMPAKSAGMEEWQKRHGDHPQPMVQ